MKKCGFKKGKSPRLYQSIIRDEIFEDLEKGTQNFFISLPQSIGKTVTALAVVSKLINGGLVENILIILPGKELVSHWVEEVQKFFYGMSLVKYTPERGVTKCLQKVRYSNAVGIAMTAHSLKSRSEKEEIREDMFDAVLVDEACDIVMAKDFLKKFRLSAYIKGLEKWKIIKIFTQPYKVNEEKLEKTVSKFGKDKTKVIRKPKSEFSIKELEYNVKNTISVDDPFVQGFVEVLDERCRRARRNIKKKLDDLGVKGYFENVETLLVSATAKRLQKKYRVSDGDLEDLQNTIRAYQLIRHLSQWFLYSNRDEIARTLLQGQDDVKLWLSKRDKKLKTLAEEVQKDVQNGNQIYIFSKYLETAKQIIKFLRKHTSIPEDNIFYICSGTEEQYNELEKFQKRGDVLVATPVFKRGTDIPAADVMIPFTPPFNREKLINTIARIRGGQLKFLAYRGSEKESVDNLVKYLQEEFSD